MIPTDALTAGGIAVSGISLAGLDRNREYIKAAILCGGLAVALILATQLHLTTLTASEMTLVWALPGLAALDLSRRSIPLAIVVPLFGFAALAHWMLFNWEVPLIVLAFAAFVLAVPFGRAQFAPGDRVVVAWLLYAFGLLGFLASVVAVLTSMGRKDVPFITHVCCATVVLLIPFALLCQHAGRIAWRF